MRHLFFRTAGLVALVFVLAVIFTVGSTTHKTLLKGFLTVGSSLAQTDDDTDAATDSVIVEEEEPVVKKVKKDKDSGVSIRIDESGIRIEGSVDVDAEEDSASSRIVIDSGRWSKYDDKRRYNEKGDDVVKFGENVSIDSDEFVRGDVVVFGGDVDIAGKVVGNLVVIAGNAVVLSGAEINGDVVILGGTLDEEAEVIIHGERVTLDSLNFSFAALPFMGHQVHLLEFFMIPVKFFISVILSFLIILFLKERVVRSQEHVATGVFKSFGAGFLVAFIGTFVVTFLTIILLITLIGIPLAFVLIVSCVAIYIVADTIFVYALGAKVSEKLNFQTQNPFAIVLIGMAVLYLPALFGYGFSMLPFGGPLGALFKFFGFLFGLFAFLAGLGALFFSRFGSRSAPAPAPVPGPATTQ